MNGDSVEDWRLQRHLSTLYVMQTSLIKESVKASGFFLARPSVTGV